MKNPLTTLSLSKDLNHLIRQAFEHHGKGVSLRIFTEHLLRVGLDSLPKTSEKWQAFHDAPAIREATLHAKAMWREKAIASLIRP